ncbi:MAG: helicase-exonuclease AddAB subunit AddB [Sporolactobacillus sp.]
MSVRFVLGRSGSGKTAFFLKEIRGRLEKDPSGPPLIYIVPEHMTFAMEYALATTPGLQGLTRLNVYSLPRLALRVLQQEGGASRIHLNEAGIAMVLRRIVARRSRQLRVFAQVSNQTGFFQLLADTLTEFKRYCLTPEQLGEQAQSLAATGGDRRLTAEKLHDLRLIYADFLAALAEKYVDGDDYLRLASEKMAGSDLFSEADVWIDGFQTMAPEEQLVVSSLYESAAHVAIAVGCDRVYDRPPEVLSYFYHPARLYLALRARAEELGVALEPVMLKTKMMRGVGCALETINRSFGHYPPDPSPLQPGLTVLEAGNRRGEVERAARTIIMLAREKGYRFRDMTVLARRLDDYGDLIDTLFADYGIPVFVDRKKPMYHHPLIECIRSALETFRRNWRYESVFRCVKTDLFLPQGAERRAARFAFDRLENVVIAAGINGKKRWTASDSWDEAAPGDANAYGNDFSVEQARRAVVAPLAAFEDKLRAAVDIRGQCTAVYRFLVALSVPEKLSELAHAATADARMNDVREHRQAWEAVIELLDQCVEGAGAQAALPIAQFCDVIEAGMERLEFVQVPPAIDQVQVSPLERMRVSDWKAVFLLGANEGIFPAKPTVSGLFSDDDRRLLTENGLALADGEDAQIAMENEWVYRGLTLASSELYLSYPLADESGETLKVSPIIGFLQQLFPKLAVERVTDDVRLLEAHHQLACIAAPRRAISDLAAQLRDWQRGYPIADLWWDAYNWMVGHGAWRRLGRHVLSALFSTNEARLRPQTAEALYGKTLIGSVSRLERFCACPFSQFVSYGLRLRERQVYDLAAPDIGEFFHLAICQMTEQLLAKGRFHEELTSDDCDTLATETVERLSDGLRRHILTSSGRYRYLQRQLTRILSRVIKIMSRQAAHGDFMPIGLELPFGPNKKLPPLNFQLGSGQSMQIVGRIDRVDSAETAGRHMLRIIDYKSGNRNLNLSDVYYGLALQMLTYLDVVTTYSEQLTGRPAEPAGVLYFHVQNPLLTMNEPPAAADIDEQLMKAFKMKGLLLEDADALLLHDHAARASRSLVAPFGFTKAGGLYKGSSVVSAQQLAALTAHTRGVMKQAGQAIAAGTIDISPYRTGQLQACTYCPYRSVCQFDQSQRGNQYRQLARMPDGEVLKRIEEEAGKID